MASQARDKLQLPMVRLALAQPFLDAALRSGQQVQASLESFCLSEASFEDQEQFVTAAVMYDLVETLAELTGDPHCGVNLGTSLNPFEWPPLADAARQAQSVGDLLLRFSIDAYRDANSVEFKLETRGSRTTFTERRVTDGGRLPRHNDGFGAAYILSILRQAMGGNWAGHNVLVQVCDPEVFPPGHWDIKVAGADTSGFSVSFPSTWLLLAPQLKSSAADDSRIFARNRAPSDTLAALRYVLEKHLHEPGLDAEHVAELCGISKRTLVRRLSDMGTSLKSELDQLRQVRAEALLREGKHSVADISESLGYRDPTVFTRAFRRWAGSTPTDYRNRFASDRATA